MNLGEAIRTHRAAKGWTLEVLSEKSGVDVGTISALEMRGSSRSKYTGAIAKGLGMTVEQLLSGEAAPQPPKVDQTDLAASFDVLERAMSSMSPAGLRNMLNTIEMLMTETDNKEARRQYVLSLLSGELPKNETRRKTANA